jgi:hypothetical protein
MGGTMIGKIHRATSEVSAVPVFEIRHPANESGLPSKMRDSREPEPTVPWRSPAASSRLSLPSFIGNDIISATMFCVGERRARKP